MQRHANRVNPFTNEYLAVPVNYDAEIECAVIDMMQVKNLHGNVTTERVYDYA